ncbi:leucine-rich repeat domain-containing protein [Chloroflexota bacterium]
MIATSLKGHNYLKASRLALKPTVFVLLVSLFLLLLLLGCAEAIQTEKLTTIMIETERVDFYDENLDALIRERFDKTSDEEIVATELATIEVFVANGRGITNLSGIQYCFNLTKLHLHENQISDISPLSNLTKLSYLGLNNNQIRDISPLTSLTNLTEIHIHDSEISDISPLSNLTKLSYLGLNNNQIRDISPLASLTNLTDLWLDDNQIGDVSHLSNLTSLTSLHLGGNQIRDILPLASLSNLTNLWLNDNQIIDISPLLSIKELSGGDRIYLRNNPLNDLSMDIYIPQLKIRGVSISFE